MKIKQNLLGAFFVCAFYAFTAFGQTEAPKTQISLYGVQTLVYVQSMRLTVQNSRFFAAETVPRVRVRVAFDFYEASATEPLRLRFVRRLAHEATIAGGEAAFFEIPSAREGSLVSASVFTTCLAETVSCDGSVRVASTLSLREAGRTILNLPAVEKGFDPQPDPPVSTIQDSGQKEF